MRNLKRRRAGWIAALAATVALAVPAFASGASYTGTFNGGGTVSFKTATKNGKIVGVKDFAWRNVPTLCAQGPFSYSGKLPYSLNVRNKAFSIKATGGGVIQSVIGAFTNNKRRASGTLNIYGNLGRGHANCSTGLVQWSATRG